MALLYPIRLSLASIISSRPNVATCVSRVSDDAKAGRESLGQTVTQARQAAPSEKLLGRFFGNRNRVLPIAATAAKAREANRLQRFGQPRYGEAILR